MPVSEFHAYYRALNRMQAGETLLNYNIADWPYTSKQKRNEIWAKLKAVHKPVQHVAQSTADIAKIIGGLSGR